MAPNTTGKLRGERMVRVKRKIPTVDCVGVMVDVGGKSVRVMIDEKKIIKKVWQIYNDRKAARETVTKNLEIIKANTTNVADDSDLSAELQDMKL